VVGARFERGRRRGQRTRRATQIAHRQRHLGLGNHTAAIGESMATGYRASSAPVDGVTGVRCDSTGENKLWAPLASRHHRA
jgi:hypothetical protein